MKVVDNGTNIAVQLGALLNAKIKVKIYTDLRQFVRNIGEY